MSCSSRTEQERWRLVDKVGRRDRGNFRTVPWGEGLLWMLVVPFTLETSNTHSTVGPYGPGRDLAEVRGNAPVQTSYIFNAKPQNATKFFN